MYQDNFQLVMNHLEKDFWKYKKNQFDARKNSDCIWHINQTAF